MKAVGTVTLHLELRPRPVTLYDCTARHFLSSAHGAQVEPMPNTSRPFVSFKANGNYYYIQGHVMEDKVLLKTLLGRDLKDHEK